MQKLRLLKLRRNSGVIHMHLLFTSEVVLYLQEQGEPPFLLGCGQSDSL